MTRMEKQFSVGTTVYGRDPMMIWIPGWSLIRVCAVPLKEKDYVFVINIYLRSLRWVSSDLSSDHPSPQIL